MEVFYFNFINFFSVIFYLIFICFLCEYNTIRCNVFALFQSNESTFVRYFLRGVYFFYFCVYFSLFVTFICLKEMHTTSNIYKIKEMQLQYSGLMFELCFDWFLQITIKFLFKKNIFF